MFIPIKRKYDHCPTEASIKSVKGFIRTGIKIAAAKPLYFHQTLTFPLPFPDEEAAKQKFNKFMKAVIKFYGKHGLAALYVQEKRKSDESIHYHICFLIFTPDSFPFQPSRFYRDFRTNLFNRWNNLNNGKLARGANELKRHELNFDTINYFAGALEVLETPPKRGRTNWWGLWNKELVNKCLFNPTKEQINHWFDEMFNKSKPGKLTSSLQNHLDRINNHIFIDEWQRDLYQAKDCELKDISF